MARKLRDNTIQFLNTVGSSWWKDTGGNHCIILDAKGGWGLYALCSSKRQGKELEGCRSKVHSSGKLDEARLLGKLAKCENREQM